VTVAERLLEREGQLSVLRSATNDAAQRRGSFALVVGEAGIGKSTLLRALVGGLDNGVRALVGACDDLLTPRALGPFRDIARSGAPKIAAALTSNDRDAALGAILAELDDPLHPVVVIIEDVHWADDATMDALRYLVPRITTLPVLVVLSYRESEIAVDHHFRRVLEALSRTRPRRIVLRGLSLSAIKELSRGTGADPNLLLSLTDGNPFFLTEILASPDGPIPASVADAVLARVGQLSSATQDALTQLAVLPGAVEGWLVDRLVPERQALVEAEAHGLIRVDALGVTFRHELARRAVVESMLKTEELDRHRRVLAAMVDHGTIDPPRILHHAVAVADTDATLRFGPPAARAAAAAGAHRQALAHYQQVLAWSEGIDPEELARLHEEIAWELYNAHRFDDGAAQALAAVSLRRTLGEPVAHGQALVSLSRLQYNSNDASAAMESIEQATQLLGESGETGPALRASIYHGALLELVDRPAEAITVLERAVQVAERSRSYGLRALASNYLGCARMDLDDPSGISLLEDSITSARALDQQEIAVRGYVNLCEGLAYLQDHERLRRYVPEGRRYAAERDFAAHEYVIEAFRCLLLALDGRPVDAEQALRQLVATSGEPGNTGRYSLPQLARLAARHDAADARELLESAWANAVAGDSLSSLAPGAVAALEYGWLTGDDQIGRDGAAAVLDRLREAPGRSRHRGELLRWLRRIGMDAAVPGPVADPYGLGLKGNWQAAADAWMRLGDAYEAALELAEAAEGGAVRQSLAILDGLGAVATARRVRQRLRDLGACAVPRGPQPATRANPGGLTPRQAEVLTLLAQQLTNAQVADRLVISVRTVDHHVAAILQKFGVASRQEAVQAARALDLPPADSHGG
jgi:DNA-binding CsgD family transcriptional regulator/tetratricopeptide (TPR) repeat protein/energy-coupling factor transporter ATP-binding protein EcfA2